MAEVNGHNTVGDMPVGEKQSWLEAEIGYPKKLTYTPTTKDRYLFGSVPLRNRYSLHGEMSGMQNTTQCIFAFLSFHLKPGNVINSTSDLALTDPKLHHICVLRTKMEVQKVEECFLS